MRNWPIVLAFGIIKVNYHQIQPQEDNIQYFRYDNIHLNIYREKESEIIATDVYAKPITLHFMLSAYDIPAYYCAQFERREKKVRISLQFCFAVDILG